MSTFKKSSMLIAVVLLGIVFALPAARAAEKTESDKSAANQSNPEIRRVMAQTADRALHKDAVNQVLDMVNSKDRERIQKDIVKGDDAKYQAVCDDVLKAWKAKYSKDFDAEGNVGTLGELKIIVDGEGTGATAHINLPAEPGENAFELRMVREKNGYWRIELPDSLDGKTFYSKLLAAVQNVDDSKEKLPGSMRKGYERVTTMLLQEMAFPAGAK
jgi:hypothetical protein